LNTLKEKQLYLLNELVKGNGCGCCQDDKFEANLIELAKTIFFQPSYELVQAPLGDYNHLVGFE
jgi:hypothetical protein